MSNETLEHKEVVRRLCEEAQRELKRKSAISDEQRRLGETDASNPPNELLSALHDAQGLLRDTAPTDPDALPTSDEGTGDQGESEIQNEAPPPTEAEASKAESLFLQAREKLELARSQSDMAIGLLRKSTQDIYEAGGILLEAQRLLKAERRWRASLNRAGIPPASAWEAIELYRRTGADTARIFAMTPTEAKTSLGIYKERISRSADTRPGESSDADSDKSGPQQSSHPRRAARPKAASTQAAKPVAPQPEVTPSPPPPEDIVLTDADQAAVTTFVESAGGWTRAALVFQSAWKLFHDQEKEEIHAA